MTTLIPLIKGLIALDIDGTVTAETNVPLAVVSYLNHLKAEGWLLAFITGRPFSWAQRTLQAFPFDCLCAVQNGALLLELPSRKILAKNSLTADYILPFTSICQEMEIDFVLYSGYEEGDVCYYPSHFFSKQTLDYMLKRAEALKEKWIEVSSISVSPGNEFSAFKCFLNEKKAYLLSQKIKSELKLHAPYIKDPFSQDYFVLQVTHPLACKGKIVQKIYDSARLSGPIIAAGNDYNDFDMLEIATVKIAMADAPDNLRVIADIIAPPAKELGLILGLSQAIKKFTN